MSPFHRCLQKRTEITIAVVLEIIVEDGVRRFVHIEADGMADDDLITRKFLSCLPDPLMGSWASSIVMLRLVTVRILVRHYWRKMGYGKSFRAMLDEANDTEKAARRVFIKPLKIVLSAHQEPR